MHFIKMADTEKEQRSKITELVKNYHELEKKVGNLIDKKKTALEWLDNRYVYIIIVLSALIGAAKDKLDSFYDDFQENLIDLHHNQRTKCIERRKKLENIQKQASKKRKIYQRMLKTGSPKKAKNVIQKSKTKIADINEKIVSEFEMEEFIDYQFDTKEVLKKIILAMVTSTDIKLVQAPFQSESAEPPSGVKLGKEKGSDIEAKISSAFGKGTEHQRLPPRETHLHYTEGVLEDDFDMVDEEDDDVFDDDFEDISDEEDNENREEMEASAKMGGIDGLAEGLPPSYEDLREKDSEDVASSRVLLLKECSDNRTDNCKISKLSMDLRPNGYSKCVMSDGSPTLSRLQNEHMQQTIFDKCGYTPHVGVTIPVKTEPLQAAKSPKYKNSVQTDSAHKVACSVESNGSVHSQRFPLDIKPLSECPDDTEDDLVINDVLDAIENNGKAGEKLQKSTKESANEKLEPSSPAITCKVQNEQGIKRADNLKPVKISEVRLQGSRFHSGIFISDNRILFPDYIFEKLKIFDLKGNEIKEFTLYRKPWDVACNPKGEIIVSFPNSLCIKRYKMVRNDLVELNSLDLFAFGVDGFDDILGVNFLVVHEKSVNILEANGLMCRKIKTSCMEPKVVGAKDGSKFYYTDGNNILCETKRGQKLCTYSYPINETPIALSLDSPGNLYVCCFNSGQISIYKISASGKHLLIAKLDWREPDLPRKIVFDSKGEHFFIISHLETPPNLTHVERSRELLVVQAQIMEAGLAEIYKLPCRNFETIL